MQLVHRLVITGWQSNAALAKIFYVLGGHNISFDR